MAAEEKAAEDQAAEQLEFSFPDPEEFPSYDEVNSEDGQAELPADSFMEMTADLDAEGCCVR